MNIIYVDNNATTRVDPVVVEAMMPYYSENYGNPSSMHAFGGNVGRAVNEAREHVASLINASPDEIIFTSCGTESDSTAIWATISSIPDKKHIITSRVEHPAVKNLYEHLAKKGYKVTFVPVDRQGIIDLDFLYDHLTEDTALISIMWANNETGVIYPIDEIARAANDRGIVVHTDAVQAVGKIPVDVQKTSVDLLSLSGHKIHAPKGVGALYVRKGTKFTPFLIGGHQENGRRGGTENVANIVGLGKASMLAADLPKTAMTEVGRLRDKLEQGLISRVQNSMINGDPTSRLPNTTNISFEYIEGESILLMMNELNICASSGSACTSGSLEPSHVLRAMGIPFTAAHGSIRFSLSHYNTEEEMDFIVDKMPPIIDRLRQMSPFWNQGKPDETMLTGGECPL
ncbi:MAG: cysteine desulfurase NifS [Desulfobacterales bacterium]|nr:cysteine desulfurase NifS [Desulfobacterales bacterium]MDX2513308.1 cysteine desulfurase NifS [Desulfobacterales bacterium]